jgi:hypothetical protein
MTLELFASAVAAVYGDFFQPLSRPMLVGILGALISGWKTPFECRVWLWLPVIMFIIFLGPYPPFLAYES